MTVAYARHNKTKILSIETELVFYPGRTRLMFTCVLGRHAASTALILLVPNHLIGAPTTSLDRCAEIKEYPFSSVKL